jgi:3,4-dihydroxy 2-butanone 4-phosphate synthase/GTP cyclohydrolase II
MNQIELVIKDLKNGNIIIVTDEENRENEGDILFASQFSDINKINFCLDHCSGVICVAISEDIANRLKLNPMEKVNTDPFYTAFYSSLDADPKYGVTTGISSYDRNTTIKMLSNENFVSSDFRRPGHVFPIVAKKYGILERMGHTEAAVDMMKFSNLSQSAVICELRNKNGNMMKGSEIIDFAQKHNIKIISTQQIKDYALFNSNFIEKISEANLPTKFGLFRISIYQNLINAVEHVVLIPHDIDLSIKPFVRVHSECITSEVFNSLKCDCKEQLNQAMQLLQERKNGAIIYLRNHEGRGIGLGNKIKSYNLQDKGFNTSDANKELNLKIDAREYNDAAAILSILDYSDIDLYTGNGEKICTLERLGFKINQIIPKIRACKENKEYIKHKINNFNFKYEIYE